MPRPATGQIVERQGKDGRTYRSLRFRAGGRRHTVPLGVISRADAERELGFVMADVARGMWKPPAQAVVPADVEIPTFHEFAETWWTLHEHEWRAKTVADYRWKLECHLLPAVGDQRLDAITISDVEQYAASKLLADGHPLSPRSINATITLLAQILEAAVDRDLIGRNPARGRGRKVRERPPARTYLETAAQIAALLQAAGELDGEARKDRQHVHRRAMLATLTFAGLRIGEMCALRWSDVDLAAGWLNVLDAKTPAGVRRVKIRRALGIELQTVREQSLMGPNGFVFATRTGRRPSRENIRSRVLLAAVERANTNLAKQHLPPLPEKLTPHSLRRTFASILYALGEDPGVVMDEMGHADPALALRVYRQAMRRGEEEKDSLAPSSRRLGLMPAGGSRLRAGLTCGCVASEINLYARVGRTAEIATNDTICLRWLDAPPGFVSLPVDGRRDVTDKNASWHFAPRFEALDEAIGLAWRQRLKLTGTAGLSTASREYHHRRRSKDDCLHLASFSAGSRKRPAYAENGQEVN